MIDMKLYYISKNIFKVVYWIFILMMFMNYLGTLYGIIAFAVLCFIWNIVLTILWEKDSSDRTILNIIFSTSKTLPFTVYGCYCSPSYGVDGRTNELQPIDELDNACRKHDNLMLAANYQLMCGAITKAAYVKIKNRGDWNFMKEAAVSENASSGIYLIGLEIGFLFRIISRFITKA
jgi:hypothetical protein